MCKTHHFVLCPISGVSKRQDHLPIPNQKNLAAHVKDLAGRLVDGHEDRSVLLRGELLQHTHGFKRERGVQTRRGLLKPEIHYKYAAKTEPSPLFAENSFSHLKLIVAKSSVALCEILTERCSILDESEISLSGGAEFSSSSPFIPETSQRRRTHIDEQDGRISQQFTREAQTFLLAS